MKAILVSCFNYYDQRLKYVREHIESLDYNVTYIFSDFDHINKVKFIKNYTNSIQINTPEYKKNISLNRIYSHYAFSKALYKEVEKINPDLIYAMFPPNLVANSMSNYKLKNPKVKLVFDIYDLWPESFPINKIKNKMPFIFKKWANFRNLALRNADYIYTECHLYQNILKKELDGLNTGVLYLTKEKGDDFEYQIDFKYFDICYLGSINNIINIKLITDILKEINTTKEVRLHIIGDGERKKDFLRVLNEANINYIYYGKIFNDSEKKEIMSKCQFGLNLMQESVSVGLTMKSVDYIEGGLPLINNIKADTEKIVDTYNIGINVGLQNPKIVARQIVKLTPEDIYNMKNNTKLVFDKYFAIEAFKSKLDNIFL